MLFLHPQKMISVQPCRVTQGGMYCSGCSSRKNGSPDQAPKKEVRRIEFNNPKSFLLPGTSLASVESLSMPLVHEVVISADFRCAECQRRIADIITSRMNGILLAQWPSSRSSFVLPDDGYRSINLQYATEYRNPSNL